MQLAQQVREARLAKDRPVVKKRLLTQADLGIVLFELFRNLINEMILSLRRNRKR